MRHIEEIEEVWFEGYESISFEPFAWAQPMHAISGQRTLVTPQAHAGGLVPKIST